MLPVVTGVEWCSGADHLHRNVGEEGTSVRLPDYRFPNGGQDVNRHDHDEWVGARSHLLEYRNQMEGSQGNNNTLPAGMFADEK